MSRLNKEREQLLQPKRIEYAVKKIEEAGFQIKNKDKTKVQFDYNGSTVTFFAYSGWHTGKTITDGRGIDNLLKQLV